MPNVSYAQNREDVLLSRVLPGPVGSYIDVGAADPVELSVTKWFYDRGWRAERERVAWEALRRAEPRADRAASEAESADRVHWLERQVGLYRAA